MDRQAPHPPAGALNVAARDAVRQPRSWATRARRQRNAGLARRCTLRRPARGGRQVNIALRSLACAVLLVGALFAASPCAAVGAERPASGCGPNPKPTPPNKLPKQFDVMTPKESLVGSGKLWARPLGDPDYMAGGGWTQAKLPWFRLTSGQLLITAHRVDGESGDFTAHLPPMSGYPVKTNAAVGTGFIPSALTFSTGGCWKVTAQLRKSRVVQYVDIDDSTRAICAALAKQLVDASNQPDSAGWINAIKVAQAAHRCESRPS